MYKRQELAGRFAEPLAQGRVTLLAASSASPEATAAWEARLKAEFPGMKLLSDQLSLGVSCHIGEGGMGVGLSEPGMSENSENVVVALDTLSFVVYNQRIVR